MHGPAEANRTGPASREWPSAAFELAIRDGNHGISIRCWLHRCKAMRLDVRSEGRRCGAESTALSPVSMPTLDVRNES